MIFRTDVIHCIIWLFHNMGRIFQKQFAEDTI